MSMPKAVEELSFKSILEKKIIKLKQLVPNIVKDLVDSDPALALLEESAYTEGLIRNKLNQNILAVTVQYATGSDLDNLGKLYGIERKLIKAEDNSSTPAIEAMYETDENLRQRIMEAPKGFSVAGPKSAYIYHGKLADTEVKDISATSSKPGVIDIVVLSYNGNGTASEELLQKVKEKLNDEEIRPLGDQINVKGAEVADFEINLKLAISNIANKVSIKKQVEANIKNYVYSQHKLAGIIAISGIYATCHGVEEVQMVTLINPKADIKTEDHEAPYCTKIVIDVVSEAK